MINFQFKRDDGVLARDAGERLVSVDAGLIQWSYFVLPINFNVNGVEMFLSNQPHGLAKEEYKYWLALPLIDMATVGYERVQQLTEGSSLTYDLPDVGMQLSLVRKGEEVTVSTPGWAQSTCRYSELSSAFERFVEEAKEFLKQAAPALLKHPRWGTWLNESDPTRRG